MRPSEDCVRLNMRLEGYSDLPYLCPSGHATIGYGSRFYADGRAVTLADPPITKADAETLLRGTMARVWGSVQGMLAIRPTQGQIDALTLFVYNVGEAAFRASTLLRLFNAGDILGASKEFARWDKMTVDGRKVVSNGLANRRKLERSLFDSRGAA